MIYVALSPDRTCVKIGFSKKNPVERCEQLEAAHPARLVLLLVLRGDKSVERYFHNRFDTLRVPIRREWFQMGREIEDWLRVEEGIITRPFSEWLLHRTHYDNPIGTFARGAFEGDFPRAAKSYFVVEEHLRSSGASSETHAIFEEAWREFLRDEVRKELATHSIDNDKIRPERSDPVRPERSDLVRPERSDHVLPEHLERVVDIFDGLMPKALMENPGRAQAIDTILCFKIEGAGEWTLDCSKQTLSPTCTRGISNKALCTIEMGANGFVSMLFDPNAGMKLYFQNRLRIFGDLTQASKIASVFELAIGR